MYALTNAEAIGAILTGLSAFLIAYMEFRANRVTTSFESRITILEHQVKTLEDAKD